MKKFESLYCILETKIVYQLYINKKISKCFEKF